MLSVFIHYAEKKRKKRSSAGLCGACKGLYCIQLLLSDHSGGCSGSHTGISRSYLFRAFQAYQKQSPKEYLTEYRIRQACHLLRETGLSVASIAYSVGFEDNLYFSKAFKEDAR